MIVTQIGHVVAALAVGWLVLASYRWIQRQSAVLGAIVAMTVIGRAALGLALFWISYLRLPIAESLQYWDPGFWQLATDAPGYYHLAADAAREATLRPLDHSVPSPLFVTTLALWMMAVGISPAAAMFLNLCLYMALMVMLIRTYGPVNDWRRDLPCIIGVAAYSFAPVILFTSTQSLKDELASVLVAMACLGALALRHLIYRPPTTGRFWGPGVGVITVGVAIFGIAAVRWQVAFIIWGALGLWLAILAVRGRTTPLPRYLVGSVTVLLAGALGIWGGAGHYSDFWRWQSKAGIGRGIAEAPSYMAIVAQDSRIGFLNSGGGTNIVMSVRGSAPGKPAPSGESAPAGPGAPAAAVTPTASPTPTQDDVTRAIPQTLPEHAKAIASGLGVIFVPISLLRAISAVEIDGGRGFLSFTDLDTAFLDVASLLVLVLLWRRRHTIGDRLPFVVFGLILSVTTAALLGYVVTNFGTLWRIRPLIAVPLWILVVALSPRAKMPRESSDVREQLSAATSMASGVIRRADI